MKLLSDEVEIFNRETSPIPFRGYTRMLRETVEQMRWAREKDPLDRLVVEARLDAFGDNVIVRERVYELNIDEYMESLRRWEDWGDTTGGGYCDEG